MTVRWHFACRSYHNSTHQFDSVCPPGSGDVSHVGIVTYTALQE
jgi:hypothetical protein